MVLDLLLVNSNGSLDAVMFIIVDLVVSEHDWLQRNLSVILLLDQLLDGLYWHFVAEPEECAKSRDEHQESPHPKGPFWHFTFVQDELVDDTHYEND